MIAGIEGRFMAYYAILTMNSLTVMNRILECIFRKDLDPMLNFDSSEILEGS